MNIGEEICGEWLRHVKGCEFVQYNLRTPDVQGEIDVIGICLATHTVYACEVAVHLVTGLQYVKDNRPDNVARLVAKFRKDIQYTRHAFPDYHHEFMFWSPVVKNQRSGAKYNQTDDVQSVVATIEAELGTKIQPVINDKFKEALDALRKMAAQETTELDSTVTRLLQVEEHLAKHLKLLRPTESVGSAKPQSTAASNVDPDRPDAPERVGLGEAHMVGFKLQIHSAYWEGGFFNVPVDYQRCLSDDEGPVEIFLGNADQPTPGRMTRSAQQNATPRVYGNKPLKKFFQSGFKVGDYVTVEFMSPRSVRIGGRPA